MLAAEYRGYSGNPGEPIEPGLARDADAFYAAARTDAGHRRLLVLGHSLGSGVALGLARRQRLDAIITIGAFTDVRRLAPRIVRAFIANRYENLDAVKALDEPIFLIHGSDDDIVPAFYGRDLGKAAVDAGASSVAFFVSGAGHRPTPHRMAALIPAILAYCDGRRPASLPDVRTLPFGRFAEPR